MSFPRRNDKSGKQGIEQLPDFFLGSWLQRSGKYGI